MSEKLKESLSAVVDGEADEFELRRVLDEIGKDETLAVSWERYHIIGATLRGERPRTSAGMRERIWAELEADAGERALTQVETPELGLKPLSSGSRRRWAPLALAATVVLAVVIGFAGFDEPVVDGTPELAVAESAAGSEVGSAITASQESLYQVAALREEIFDSDHNRTEAYIVRHYQQIGMDRPGIGFTRMVAYERD